MGSSPASGEGKVLLPLTAALMKSCHWNNVSLKRSQAGGLSHLEVKVCFLFPNFFPWNLGTEAGFLAGDCCHKTEVLL